MEFILEYSEFILEKNSPTNKKLWASCIAWAKRTFDVYPSAYCVPLDSEALTKKGWKKHNELTLNDEILAYDPNSDSLKWTPLLNIHFYENQKTIKMIKSGLNFEITCTPNHRWLYYRESINQKINDESIKIFDLIQKIKNKEISIEESKKECKTIARHYQRYKNSDYLEFLNKSKFISGGVKFIETKDLPRAGYILSNAKLDKSYPSCELPIISKYGNNWVETILNMSLEQLEVFFLSAIIYDGNQVKDITTGKGFNDSNERIKNNVYGFKQKDKIHADIFELSAFLTGRNIKRNYIEKQNLYSFSITEKRNYSLLGMVYNESDIQNVWCPETEYGTWVMRQNNRIMITGNSNGAAARRYKSKGGKWKKSKK